MEFGEVSEILLTTFLFSGSQGKLQNFMCGTTINASFMDEAYYFSLSINTSSIWCSLSGSHHTTHPIHQAAMHISHFAPLHGVLMCMNLYGWGVQYRHFHGWGLPFPSCGPHHMHVYIDGAIMASHNLPLLCFVWNL